MTLQDTLVAAVLRSRLHRALSGSTGLVRYTGRRTGRVVQTPTQYVRGGQDVVRFVGIPGAGLGGATSATRATSTCCSPAAGRP